MPTYEYRCPKCGTTVEIVQRITERRNPLCCEETCCANVEMEPVISAPMFILKGSGWAKDGYSKTK